MGARHRKTGKVTINGQTFDVHDIKIVAREEPVAPYQLPIFNVEYTFVIAPIAPTILLPSTKHPPRIFDN
jgi:hypothetical protein